MPQSLSQIYVHGIFSTKKRINLIRKEDREDIHKYIAGIIANINGQPIEVGGTGNHIHILSTLPKTLSSSKFINKVKSNSSRWIKSIDPYYKGFKWQKGYAILSVSSDRLKTLQKYIQNQEDHHKTLSYQEEVINFLEENNVEFNLDYLWD